MQLPSKTASPSVVSFVYPLLFFSQKGEIGIPAQGELQGQTEALSAGRGQARGELAQGRQAGLPAVSEKDEGGEQRFEARARGND